MHRFSIIILDQDEEYVQRLLSYARSLGAAQKQRIQACTQFEKCEEYLQQCSASTVLLVCEEWKAYIDEVICAAESENDTETGVRQLPKRLLFTLATHRQLAVMEEQNILFKYQPLDQLIDYLAERHRLVVDELSTNHQPSEAQVIGVYSAVGGSGKTTVALNLAQQLAALNYRVLLFNLENIPSLSLFVPAESDDVFSKLVYYAKTKPQQLCELWPQFIDHAPALGCDYIAPLKHVQDADELEAADIQLIVADLIKHTHYDVMIMDMEAGVNPRIEGAITSCHHLIWLVTDDLQCRQKTALIWQYLSSAGPLSIASLQSKCQFTLNKHIGVAANEFSVAGIEVQHTLPYIPQWKSISKKEQYLEPEIFKQSITKLYYDMQSMEKERFDGTITGSA